MQDIVVLKDFHIVRALHKYGFVGYFLDTGNLKSTNPLTVLLNIGLVALVVIVIPREAVKGTVYMHKGA